MAVGAAESDCVVLEVFPTVTGIPLFQSAPSQHTQNNPARNSRPSCLCNAPSVSSGLISCARNENCRMPASRGIENTNHNSRKTFSYINPKLARHPWTDSTEFIELWSDIPSENIDHDWTDQEQTASENDSALISSFETDSGYDSSRETWILSKHPWAASGEFVELWSDIPSEFDSSRNRYKDRRGLMDQNNRISFSNVAADSKYDSPVISWDFSKHPWTASKEFVVLWSDIPNDFDASQNRSNDRGELMDKKNRISNVVADLKCDSSVISWDLTRRPWYKDFVVLWSDIPREYDSSRNRSNDRGERMDQNRISNVVADSKYDSSVLSWDSSKHPRTRSEFVELWSDIIPSEFRASQNRSNHQGERMDQNYRTSVSNIIADSNYDSSMLSWDPSKHPRTASKDFVVLWSDIPSDELDTSQNQSNDRGEWMAQNDRTSDSNIVANSKCNSSALSWDPSKHPRTASKDFVVLWSDIPSDEFDDSQNQSEDQNGSQYLSDHSGLFGNSCNDSENLTEVSIIAPDDSISNKNYSTGPEKNFTCWELFIDDYCHFENFAMNYKNSICYLVMMILLSLIPISAMCMGFAHCATGSCPANMAVTHLVYASGVSGSFFTGLHIWHHFLEGTRKEDIGRGLKTFQGLTAILLLIEMILFYSMSPSFENSENYCDETFYYYTFYMNIAAAGIVFLSVLLQYTSLKHLVDNLHF